MRKAYTCCKAWVDGEWANRVALTCTRKSGSTLPLANYLNSTHPEAILCKTAGGAPHPRGRHILLGERRKPSKTASASCASWARRVAVVCARCLPWRPGCRCRLNACRCRPRHPARAKTPVCRQSCFPARARHGLIPAWLGRTFRRMACACGVAITARRGHSGRRGRGPALSSAGGGVAQMLTGFVPFSSQGRAPRYKAIVAGVALNGDGQINHRLAQCQLAFQAAQPLVGQGGVVGGLHGAQVSPGRCLPEPCAQCAGPDSGSAPPSSMRVSQYSAASGCETAHRFMQRRNLVVKWSPPLSKRRLLTVSALSTNWASMASTCAAWAATAHCSSRFRRPARVAVGVAHQRRLRCLVKAQLQRRLALGAGKQPA